MTGNALIEESISAYPPKADICALGVGPRFGELGHH
jgi:hypothetical protein